MVINEVATVTNTLKPAKSCVVLLKAFITIGNYFYQLKTGNFVETKEMVFMK